MNIERKSSGISFFAGIHGCVSFFPRFTWSIVVCRFTFPLPLQSENGIFNFIDWDSETEKLKANMKRKSFHSNFYAGNILFTREEKRVQEVIISSSFLIKSQQFKRKIFHRSCTAMGKLRWMNNTEMFNLITISFFFVRGKFPSFCHLLHLLEVLRQKFSLLWCQINLL